MSELRWILLLFGLAVVVAVYFLGRRRGGGISEQAPSTIRHEPHFGGPGTGSDSVDQGTFTEEANAAADRVEGSVTNPGVEIGPEDPWGQSIPQSQSDFAWGDDNAGEPQAAEPPLEEEKRVFSLRVAARDPLGFAGADIRTVLQEEDLRHGKYGIFHRLHKNDEDEFLFSVASMIEPGSFDLATVDNMRMPGLSFFMVLPGPQDGGFAFSEMLACARRVADRLAGELQDHSGSTLSAQRVGNLRDEIINYEYHAGLGKHSQHH